MGIGRQTDRQRQRVGEWEESERGGGRGGERLRTNRQADHSSSTLCWLWLKKKTPNALPGIKKWRRGKGTMLTASFLRSAFSWPGNRRHVVTPDMVAETRWFKSP